MAFRGKKLEMDRSTSSRVKPLASPCHASQRPREKGKMELLPFPSRRVGLLLGVSEVV